MEGSADCYQDAGWFSKLTFSWTLPLMKLGSTKELENDDLPILEAEEQSRSLCEKITAAWDAEIARSKASGGSKKPSLIKALFKVTYGVIWPMFVCLVVDAAAYLGQTLILGRMIHHFTSDDSTTAEGLCWAGALTGITLVENILHHWYWFWSWRLGLQWRVATTTLLYSKCMKKQLGSLAECSIGYIINLATNDIERFQLAGVFFLFVLVAPLLGVVSLYVGIQEIGASFVAGWAVLVLLIPMQMRMASMFAETRKLVAQRTDQRVKVTNQAIGGARIMKLNAWEFPFISTIKKLRALEIKGVLKANYLRAINESLFFIMPSLLSLLVFLTYVTLGNTLSPRSVFTVVAQFYLLQIWLTKLLCQGIQSSSEALVSVKRLEHFLNLAEVEEPLKIGDGTSRQESAPPTQTLPWNKGKKGERQALVAEDSLAYQSLELASLPKREKQDEFPPEDVSPLKRVVLKQASFNYTKVDEAQPLLKDIDLKIHDGDFIAFVGPVGSAKTSLLMAVLNEMNTASGSGHVQVQGQIAYASQEPWVGAGTVRSNILFGKEFDQVRYEKVVECCSLRSDFAQFQKGDLTVIGDRGANLSGGQKARIGLARLAYAGDCNIFLMDDPLSAVDPAVGKHLFEKVICGHLSNKTRLLVTHQLQYLQHKSVTKIVMLEQGQIKASGTFSELAKQGLISSDFLRQIEEEDQRERMKTAESLEMEYHEISRENSIHRTGSLTMDVATDMSRENSLLRSDSFVKLEKMFFKEIAPPDGSISDAFGKDPFGNDPFVTDDSLNAYTETLENGIFSAESDQIASTTNPMHEVDEEAGLVVVHEDAEEGIIADEERNTGGVKASTYMQYIDAMGGLCAMLLVAFLMFAAQACSLITSAFLAHWSDEAAEDQTSAWNVRIFSFLIIICCVFAFSASTSTFSLLNYASKRLHDRMLEQVIMASIGFFDANPLGRIMNRFSKDLGFMDDLLPMTIYDFILCLLMVIGSLVFVSCVNPWVILSLPIMVYLFILIRNFSQQSAGALKRIEAVNRSPVYSKISETLDGLTTVRAFKQQQRFLDEFFVVLDENSNAYYYWLAVVRWLGYYLDMLVVLMVAVATFVSVIVNETSQEIPGALLGAALTYIVRLAGLFQWTVRQSAEVENQMVSVERVLHYCDIPLEKALESDPSVKPPPSWPQKGTIKATDLSVQYKSNLPPVLKNLNFEFKGGERVGIVGRTGAGKSSFVSALFRLVEKMPGGMLEIDDRNVSELGLHDLRLKMSVIPQTPFLFSGSIRQNLDPFETVKDEEKMWVVLETVQLAQGIRSLPEGLDTLVAESGGNWSVGQRQLLCLARALLAQNRILVMDEATANIDLQTDSLIQKAVRTKFQDCTVIMIAHRLHTVIDCDKILVLGRGEVIEFGSPYELLQKSLGEKTVPPNSFLSMVNETGSQTSADLQRLARKYHLERLR